MPPYFCTTIAFMLIIVGVMRTPMEFMVGLISHIQHTCQHAYNPVVKLLHHDTSGCCHAFVEGQCKSMRHKGSWIQAVSGSSTVIREVAECDTEILKVIMAIAYPFRISAMQSRG